MILCSLRRYTHPPRFTADAQLSFPARDCNCFFDERFRILKTSNSCRKKEITYPQGAVLVVSVLVVICIIGGLVSIPTHHKDAEDIKNVTNSSHANEGGLGNALSNQTNQENAQDIRNKTQSTYTNYSSIDTCLYITSEGQWCADIFKVHFKNRGIPRCFSYFQALVKPTCNEGYTGFMCSVITKRVCSLEFEQPNLQECNRSNLEEECFLRTIWPGTYYHCQPFTDSNIKERRKNLEACDLNATP
ncbi:unnamed protein product [Mytilus coruscus]|uniref:Uncharacterized protein n=1 Tax=Mytilus coruscus TaxID=42192 RepID=A0A6J8AD11_MYTCO|nr:unnamed protein product [Mytilus coruscus]